MYILNPHPCNTPYGVWVVEEIISRKSSSSIYQPTLHTPSHLPCLVLLLVLLLLASCR
jgi:hypothetical protein